MWWEPARISNVDRECQWIARTNKSINYIIDQSDSIPRDNNQAFYYYRVVKSPTTLFYHPHCVGLNNQPTRWLMIYELVCIAQFQTFFLCYCHCSWFFFRCLLPEGGMVDKGVAFWRDNICSSLIAGPPPYLTGSSRTTRIRRFFIDAMLLDKNTNSICHHLYLARDGWSPNKEQRQHLVWLEFIENCYLWTTKDNSS